MTLGKLLELYNSGALNVKYDKDEQVPTVGVIGGVRINATQASALCTQMGWLEYVLNPFEVLEKTSKFIKSLKQHLKNDVYWQGQVTFQNIRSNTYGKTFDRIQIQTRYGGVSILYNMEHSGGKYVIYNVGGAIPLAKCRNLKQVSEYFNVH